MDKFIIRLALWLLEKCNYRVVKLEDDMVISRIDKFTEHRIDRLIARFNDLQSDGEWKAHQVYAQLIKDYPRVRKSDLRLQMELIYNKYWKDRIDPSKKVS